MKSDKLNPLVEANLEAALQKVRSQILLKTVVFGKVISKRGALSGIQAGVDGFFT